MDGNEAVDKLVKNTIAGVGEAKMYVGEVKHVLIGVYLKGIENLLYDSGYVHHPDGLFSKTPSRPYKIYTTNKMTECPIVAEGHTFQQIVAFTEDGIMADASGGGASTVKLDDMPAEDVVLVIEKLVEHILSCKKEKEAEGVNDK